MFFFASVCPPTEMVVTTRMARIDHIREALLPLVFFILISLASAVDSDDPFDATAGSQYSDSGPFSRNSSMGFDMSDLGFPHLLQRRACPVGSSLCVSMSGRFFSCFSLLTSSFLDSGRCCPEPSDGCCKDGTCGRLSRDFCCSGGGLCAKGEICCDGCAPPGSQCCSSGKYCRKGYKCCEGRCIPDGTECCKGGYYCPRGKYCKLFSGQVKCCRTSNCREYDNPVSDDDTSDDDDDPITRPPSSTTIYESMSRDSVYYTDISWTYYRYWYIYVYIIIEIDVTTTTVSLTSTPTVTSSRMSVSAADTEAAREKFHDMSSSLEASAASAHKQESTPTSGTVTIDSTPAPCVTGSQSAGCMPPNSAALGATPVLWMVLGVALPLIFLVLL